MSAAPAQEERRPAVLLRNHERSHRLDLPLLQRMLRVFVRDLLGRSECQLDVHIVGREQITRLNEFYVRHQGVTDVVAFDYSDCPDGGLRGEIFVCLPEALVQARRFRTTWQRELVRYLVHAVLHLCGYDDRTAAERRRMRRAEEAGLRSLAARYRWQQIGAAAHSRRPGRRQALKRRSTSVKAARS